MILTVLFNRLHSQKYEGVQNHVIQCRREIGQFLLPYPGCALAIKSLANNSFGRNSSHFAIREAVGQLLTNS